MERGSFIINDSNENTSLVILPIKKGDDIFEEHSIQPSAIKIDVEGYEKKGFNRTRECYK